MLTIRKLLTVAFAMVLFFACSKSSDTSGSTTINCTGVAPGFAATIMPLIQSNCATTIGCHAAGSITSGGPFTNYTEVKNKASIIRQQVVTKAMPQTGSLTASQIQNVACWVDNGAPNN